MVRTIGDMPRTLALVGGPGWSVAGPVQGRFAVSLWAASEPGVEEMPSEQPPDCRKEGKVEKMNLALPSWMDRRW
jgi:hypothetical protein